MLTGNSTTKLSSVMRICQVQSPRLVLRVIWVQHPFILSLLPCCFSQSYGLASTRVPCALPMKAVGADGCGTSGLIPSFTSLWSLATSAGVLQGGERTEAPASLTDSSPPLLEAPLPLGRDGGRGQVTTRVHRLP